MSICLFMGDVSCQMDWIVQISRAKIRVR